MGRNKLMLVDSLGDNKPNPFFVKHKEQVWLDKDLKKVHGSNQQSVSQSIWLSLAIYQHNADLDLEELSP